MILNISIALNVVLLFLYFHSRRSYHFLMSKNLQKEKNKEDLLDKISYDAIPDDLIEKQLLQTLQNIMENDRIFLDANINIQQLAKMIGTNKNTLSHIINKYLNQNFASMLNRYRIREAIRLLSDNEYCKYKIEAIGEMCGYNNRQTFHSAFKKEIGITPSHFRNISKKTPTTEG